MDNECFKRAVTVALHHEDIKSNPEYISNIRKYINNFDWSGLKFPVAMKKINIFEKNNNMEEKIYICRKSKHNDRKNVVNLLPIADGEHRHYTAIKSLSRLLGGSNSKDGHK